MVMPETSRDDGHKLLDLLRHEVSVHEFPHGNTVTVSVGYTDNSGADTLEELMDIADKALYKAKQDGRDRIILGSINESS